MARYSQHILVAAIAGIVVGNVGLLITVLAQVRRTSRIHAGLCPKCGHDRMGAKGDCPACGEPEPHLPAREL